MEIQFSRLSQSTSKNISQDSTMSPRTILTVVSPVHNAGQIVSTLVERIAGEARKITEQYEIILVEDGSPDDSWEKIAEACRSNLQVRGIRLTRNFGQQCAITAGLECAHGECVIVMDCDLQDDPRYIPELVGKYREGYDVVLTRKKTREYGWARNAVTRVFYLILRLTGDLSRVDPHINSYSLISGRVVDTYLRIADYHRDFLMLVQWMGFRQAIIAVEQAPRYSGKSSYSWPKLIQHAVATITAHSKALLKLSIAFGFAYVASAFLATIYLIISYYLRGYRAGWASTMVMLLASTGLILLSIGVAGIYIGNIFDQVRGRPLFLVQETANCGDKRRDRKAVPSSPD